MYQEIKTYFHVNDLTSVIYLCDRTNSEALCTAYEWKNVRVCPNRRIMSRDLDLKENFGFFILSASYSETNNDPEIKIKLSLYFNTQHQKAQVFMFGKQDLNHENIDEFEPIHSCFTRFEEFDKMSSVDIEHSISYQENQAFDVFVIIRHILNPAVPTVEKLPNYVTTLFKTKIFHDAVIKVGNQEFKIHKSILASRSNYFESIFMNDTREARTNVIEITDFSPDVIDEMLRFMYTGEIKNRRSVTVELGYAADKYNLPELLDLCNECIIKNVTYNNLTAICQYADAIGNERLKYLAVKALRTD